MKHILLVLFCIAPFLSAYAQSKIVDFFSATTSAPIDKKIFITDIIYQDGKFNTIQEKIVKSRKLKRDNKDEEMATVIDKFQLIDYKSDTLYLLNTYYVPIASVSTIIKTRKGAFDLVHNADGGYDLRSLKDSYINMPKEERDSDFLLYETIFTWNIDLLIRLIQSSGGQLGNEYSISATRIILKNNQILKKDIINFEPALRWKLE